MDSKTDHQSCPKAFPPLAEQNPHRKSTIPLRTSKSVELTRRRVTYHIRRLSTIHEVELQCLEPLPSSPNKSSALKRTDSGNIIFFLIVNSIFFTDVKYQTSFCNNAN